MTLALILSVLDEAHKKGRELVETHKKGEPGIKEQAGRCADEELHVIKAGACTIHQICNETKLTSDQVIQIMKDAEKVEFVHRVVDGVKYVTRKGHVAIGQSDWTPGFEG